MLAWLLKHIKSLRVELLASQLYTERTFYEALTRDLNSCISETVIESPFITGNRVASLLPIFSKMRSRNVKIVVNTRHPSEHDTPYDAIAWSAIEQMQQVGIKIFYTGGHHRKLAVIDRTVLWEGSLNILSQNDSCEIMRRTHSRKLAIQMLDFTGVSRFLEAKRDTTNR